MRTTKSKNTFLTTVLLGSLSASVAFAQLTDTPTSTPLKTQKYNGYGMPNTKYKKIKVDLTKKSKKDAPSVSASKVEAVSATKTNSQATEPTVDQKPAVTAPTAATPAKLFGFSLDYDVGYNMQAQEKPDHSRAEYLLHEITPQLKIGNYTLVGDFYYYDDIKNPSANEWVDSAIFVKRSAWELGNYFKLTPLFLFTLPLAKASREDGGVKYAIGPAIILGLNTKNMGMENWGIEYYLRYSKFTTEYTTKPNGEPSADYFIRQRINLSYKFTEKLMLRTRFEYNSNYSTQNVVKNTYLHFENLSYQFTDMITGYVMHTVGRVPVYTITENTAGDVNYENDLKFYDPVNSELALGMTLSF